MDKNLVVDFETIEDFVENFFKSPYIANWIGVFVPQTYDLREYVLNNPFSANLKLMKILFPENLLEKYEKRLDEIISTKDVSKLVHYVLIDFDKITNFKKEKDEIFYLDLTFQLPFIWNSRFKKEEKLNFLAQKKDRYDSTFRQSLRGSLVIEKNLDLKCFSNEERTYTKITIKNIKKEQKFYRIYLAIPKKLNKYWAKFIELTFNHRSLCY